MSLIPLPQGMPSFDASQVEPLKAYEPVPTDWYAAKIIKSEVKPTKDARGSYLELELEIIDGPCSGKRGWDRLNLVNDNAVAVEIAFKTLSAICHATHQMNINDSSQLHGIPLMARFVLVAPREVNGKPYDASNEIKGYKPLESASAVVPQKSAGVATPPWTPAATPSNGAPTGWKPPATTGAPWQQPAAPAPTPTPTVVTPPPPVAASPYPAEAIEWAKANPTHPEAGPILATLPTVVQQAAAPWSKPATGAPAPAAAVTKPPWQKN